MWVDNDTIGALVIPPERGAPPEKPPVPIGPNIQDNTSGKTSQVRQPTFYLTSFSKTTSESRVSCEHAASSLCLALLLWPCWGMAALAYSKLVPGLLWLVCAVGM